MAFFPNDNDKELDSAGSDDHIDDQSEVMMPPSKKSKKSDEEDDDDDDNPPPNDEGIDDNDANPPPNAPNDEVYDDNVANDDDDNPPPNDEGIDDNDANPPPNAPNDEVYDDNDANDDDDNPSPNDEGVDDNDSNPPPKAPNDKVYDGNDAKPPPNDKDTPLNNDNEQVVARRPRRFSFPYAPGEEPNDDDATREYEVEDDRMETDDTGSKSSNEEGIAQVYPFDGEGGGRLQEEDIVPMENQTCATWTCFNIPCCLLCDRNICTNCTFTNNCPYCGVFVCDDCIEYNCPNWLERGCGCEGGSNDSNDGTSNNGMSENDDGEFDGTKDDDNGDSDSDSEVNE